MLSVTATMPFLSFDGRTVPVNNAGDLYPSEYSGAGAASVSVDSAVAVSGSSVRFNVTKNELYPQWNPYNKNGTRGFAREYVADPNQWQSNTYNRLSFWMQAPANGSRLASGGEQNYQFGTYVKQVAGADAYSDETGGGHFYHLLNIAPTGTWTKVVINSHPDHQRGADGNTEQPNLPHPTGETQYNYFDALTRFYLEQVGGNPSYPETFRFDDLRFYTEGATEADDEVRSIAATVVPKTNQLILTWNRSKDENGTIHEVRYAFSDIHEIGWDAATPAPGGVVSPPGWQGYNGMVYSANQLPLAANAGKSLYLAIKPQGSSTFSQIDLPLSVFYPPSPPMNLVAAAASTTQIRLSWTNPSNNETGIKIEQKKGNGGAWTQVAVAGPGVTSYQFAKLSPGITYFYRARAANSAGNSAYSNQAIATTWKIPTSPASLRVAAASSTQIRLRWTDRSDNETGFKIERKQGRTGVWTEIDTVGPGVTSYQNTGLVAGTTYFYRVRATNNVGNSAYSNNSSATTPKARAVARSLLATAAVFAQTDLSWVDSTGFRH